MRIDQMGDVIQTLPFFEKLAKKYPGAEIYALTAKPSRFLLENKPFIKKVFSIESSWFYKDRKIKLQEVLGLIKELKNEKIDLAFDLRGDIRNIFFLFLSGAKKICGYGCAGGGFLLDCKIDYDRGEHEIDKNLKLIGEPPVAEELKFDFFVPEADKKTVDDLFAENCISGNGKIITMHPFTLHKAKMWGIKRYDELMQNFIREHGNVRVLVIGSEAEKKFEDEFTWPEKSFNLIGKTNIFQTIEIIKRSDIFVGNDSGPQYFAAYSGVKTAIIYGSSTPYARWLPKVKKDNFIAISKKLECQNCELPECDRQNHECMDIITVEEVYDILQRWL
jgi:ADP-heptose:LPS heptosyltransferase